MAELRIAEFREILEDRDRLKSENEAQRTQIASLEKEARRAATLERELERERSRHEQAKARAKERTAEAGAYEEKLREAKADFRAQHDLLSETQQRLRETLKAYYELAELERVVEHHKAAERIRLDEIAKLRQEIEVLRPDAEFVQAMRKGLRK